MGDLLNGWSTYFQEITRLLEDAERQYGVANNNLTDYILERLEMTVRVLICFIIIFINRQKLKN